MGKKKATASKDLIKDCFVREVRVNYVATTTEQFKISGPEDIAAFSRSVLLDNSREQFIAIYLDGSHTVAAYSLISIGSANCTTMHPREVFQRAVLVVAVSLVSQLVSKPAPKPVAEAVKAFGDLNWDVPKLLASSATGIA